MKHVSNTTMKLSMRIGLAVAAALLATQVSTGRASASVQGLTITSITRTDATTIQVSGTAVFSDGDAYAMVNGTLAQIQQGTGWIDRERSYLGDVPGVGGTYIYDWTMSFDNLHGWKPGPATLTVTARSYDPSLGQGTFQTTAGKVILRK